MSGPDDQDLFEDAGPRSIFAATWFRVVLVVIVFAVVGAVAVPYVLDYMSPPPKPIVAARPPVPLMKPNAGQPGTGAPTSPAPSASTTTPQSSPSTTTPPQSPPATTQPSVSSTAPTQPTPSTALPAQPAPQSAKPAPQTAMPAPKAPAITAPTQPRPTPPVVAQAPSKPETVTPAAKSPPAEAKPESKPEATESTAKPVATKPAVAKRTVAKAAPAGSGSYWVQVGAFRDQETAKRVAAKVGGANVVVTSGAGAATSAPAPSVSAAPPPEVKEAPTGGDVYDVFVSGGAPADITRKLAGKGLASEVTAGGVVVRPSQPLREAVSLSKDLAVEGFKVQVRRAGGPAPRPAPAPAAARPAPSPSLSGDALYRVRVGPYADRAAATAALRDLDAKGYKGFIARGEQ